MNRRRFVCRCVRISPLLLAAALGIGDPLTSLAQQSWGYNFYGQLGNTTNSGLSTANPAPLSINGITGITNLAAGTYHVLATKGDGTVWAWGYNNYGALGNTTNSGTGKSNPIPTQVAAVSNIKAVSGGYHSLALANDGTVWTWGHNQYGQLGNTTNNGTTHANPTPAQISAFGGVAAVAAGWYHSLALKTDGTVWSWGYNLYGQLGYDTSSNPTPANPTPAQVTGLPTIVAIAAGEYHSLALAADGSVWAWGWNRYGQLGNGTNNQSDTQNPAPTQIAGLSQVTAIAGGAYHSLALTSDGTVWGWGYNYYGQLGNATNNSSVNPNPTPAQIASFTGVTAIASGDFHSLAVKNDGTVWTWGFNLNGQLGNGAHNGLPSPTPGQVTGVAGAAAVAGGAGDSFAIASATVAVTIASSIVGSPFSVTGTGCQAGNYSSPQVLHWLPNSACSVSFTSPQTGTPGTQYVLSSWADGSLNNPRTITTPASATTYTAQFQTQYLLTAISNPPAGGFVTGGSGYYNANTAPTITATANPGYNFFSWTGPVTTPGSAGTTVQMTGPVSVTANFVVATTPVTIASSVTGLAFTVTGTGCQPGSYSTPQTLTWTLGSSCGVAFGATIAGGAGTQYVFSTWEDSSSANPRTFSVPATATTYTADFQNQYLLTVAANPAGAGQATGGGYYNAAFNAPVAAAANSGYTFSNWSGPVASGSTASTTVPMSGPITVTANFVVATTPVTIASSVAGLSFTVAGTGCQTGSYSTPQTLTWTLGSSCIVAFGSTMAGGPGTQYVFSGWEDSSSANPRTFIVPAAATTYTANFQTQYLLTVAANPANAGQATGGGYYNAGSKPGVSVTSNSGYTFSGWTGPVASASSASTTVLMTGPMTVTANFGVATTPVTIASSVAGLTFTVTGTGCQPGSYATPQTLSWTLGSSCGVAFGATIAGGPGTQYVFSAWEDSSPANPRTFSVPATATTYTADFQTQYLLAVAVNPAAAGQATGGGYYNAGSNAPVSAAANSGFAFVNWTGAVASPGSASTAAAMTGPLTVTANFTMFTTIASSPAGLSFAVSGTGCQPGTYSTPQVVTWAPGSSCTVSFTATQAGGAGTQYVFTGWGDGPSTNPRTFLAAVTAATYTANFQRQYLLTTSVGIGGNQAGSISPGGYYNDGSVAPVSATANPGYQFTGFSGDLSGVATPQSVTMSGPHSVAANFGLLTSLTVGAASGKYGDSVNLSATLLPANLAVSGSIQFTVGGVPAGSVPVNGSGAYALPYVITQKQGQYAITAAFSSSTTGILSSGGSNNLTVALAIAIVTPSPANPAAVVVGARGGTASVALTLTATVQEAPGGIPGDISKANPVTFTLNPAVGTTPISCSPAVATVNTNTLTVACTFANLPVNVYDVTITVGGDYYTGAGKTTVAVYDPSLGFVTGNFSVPHNGATGSGSVNAKYKNDGSLDGAFGYTEQGSVTINATGLQSLSIVGNTAVLVAQVSVNGAGGYTARAFFTSNGGSGKNDQFALQVMDANGNIVPGLTFGPATLAGGNLQVH